MQHVYCTVCIHICIYIYMYISHIRYKNWELGIYIYTLYIYIYTIYIYTHSCIAHKNWEGSCVILCRTTHIQLILYLLYSISHAQPISAHRLPSTPPALQLPDEAFGVPGARRCQKAMLWGNSWSMAFRPVLKLWNHKNNMKQHETITFETFLKYCSRMPRMLSYIPHIPHITTLEHVVFQALPISLRQLAMLPELAQGCTN